MLNRLAGAPLARLRIGLSITALAVVVVALIMGRFTGRGGGPPRPPADTLRIGADTAIGIAPLQSHLDLLRIPARICTLTGRFEAAGPQPEFEALVLTDDEYRAWAISGRGGAIRSGRVAHWAPHVTLVGPGRYRLVLANPARRDSVRVRRVGATVICP